jgi:germination protein M
VKRALLLLALGLALAGCSGDDEATETTTGTTPVETATVKVYLLRDGKVWPVARTTGDILFEPLGVGELLRGPNDAERDELGLTTALPEGIGIADVEVSRGYGVSTVAFEGSDELSREALAQLVFTETAFSGSHAVRVGGRRYTRADFEEQTPSVLVESPLPFDEVSSPITASGTANTFEANFQYEVLDADGNVIDENFVTATSGTGTRGTFEFTTDDVEDAATLLVFETSAEDGSRIHEVEIPLTVAT